MMFTVNSEGAVKAAVLQNDAGDVQMTRRVIINSTTRHRGSQDMQPPFVSDNYVNEFAVVYFRNEW